MQSKNNTSFYEDGLTAFSADSLKKYISVLSSDSFEGRKPLTGGEKKTINYIQQQFSVAGLEPGNGTSFFQEVPMVSILAIAAPEMKVQSPKGTLTLKAYDDYIIWTDKTDEVNSLDNSELVFAGYGVVAPEYNWNDYEGLLGSEYFVQNPVYPLDKIVADINMECLNRSKRKNDMVIIGKGQSEPENYFREEVKKEGGYISSETHPEAGYYYRSDHFSFAKAGVPVLYAQSGLDVIGKGKEFGKKRQDEYYEKNYHRPSDEFDASTWTMEGAIYELKLLFQTGKRLVFEEKRPK